MKRKCSSCIKGNPETANDAGDNYLRRPIEAIQKHGMFLCDEHAEIVLTDWPDADITNIPAWVKAKLK